MQTAIASGKSRAVRKTRLFLKLGIFVVAGLGFQSGEFVGTGRDGREDLMLAALSEATASSKMTTASPQLPKFAALMGNTASSRSLPNSASGLNTQDSSLILSIRAAGSDYAVFAGISNFRERDGRSKGQRRATVRPR